MEFFGPKIHWPRQLGVGSDIQDKSVLPTFRPFFARYKATGVFISSLEHELTLIIGWK